MPTISELQALLGFPSEQATVEFKSWLNLAENHGKATLAKAAIALANEGGGLIILGMREDSTNGRALASHPRPPDLGRYSQDAINAAVNRYAEPQLHCGLAFASHPESNVEHAFVIVPGGMTVPVMSKRNCEGVIAAQRCYVRKPGPRTEEPFTAEEWRGVLERCLAARRESMLNAIRVIVQGHGGTEAPTDETLLEFNRAGLERWTHLIGDLPPDDDARMRLGHYEISFEIVAPPAASVTELRRRMEAASTVRYTGWGPFAQLTRQEFAPRIVEGNIEVWFGRPVDDRFLRDAAHCDYWRARPSGLFFLMRGYDEDVAPDRARPGTVIDIAIPIWRVGEALLYASRIARTYAEDPEISVRCRYTGLRDRRLGSLDRLRHFFMGENRVCHDDEAQLATAATAAELDDNLVEVLHTLLAPLYERFGFFGLPLEIVRDEVTQMRRSRS